MHIQDLIIGVRALYVAVARKVAFKLLSSARRQERIVIRHHNMLIIRAEQRVVVDRLRMIGGK